ncbi:glycosyltransferase family 39 protein [Actinomadura kijaniata]|uniref:glycosyltransferase family 39 protein n=1 Tax=Actinomadura kijaniata TaxID=46161 RepID=UPI00083487A6|nr:glycosyltransferase family 39 protein [Actinomadura kijaniata]
MTAQTITTGRAAAPPVPDPARPRWAGPALAGVLLLALLLYAWGLSANGDANAYYSAAVKSATQSWKAFFFGSLDAGSFITVDKPPMALWLMALSARVFGFNTWSVLLPQALAGVAAVALLHATVRRGFGEAAGLVAALALALTPITVAINRDNNPDTLLVLLLVAAAWATQRAVATGRLRPLLLAAFLVGCGFNTKMLQAFLVLPALALVYLLAARPSLPRRIGHLLAAGVTLAVSSFWWMLVVDLIPAGQRPYVGGSTDNSVWDLVIGYNGLGRILGQGGGGPGGGRGGASFGGASGAGRLFNDIMGGQISWLLPFAVIALVAGLVLVARRGRTDPKLAALVLWGGWLAVHYAVFSFAQGTFHPYYSTAMAPAIAALTGAGAVLLFGAYRRSARWAWVLPSAVAVTGAWAFVLLSRTPSWNPWLRWVVVACTVLAVANLAAARLTRRAGLPVMVAGLVMALLAALSGPAAYAVSAASSRVNGTNPLAGPTTGRGFGPGGGGQGRMVGRDGSAEVMPRFPGGQAPPGGMRDGEGRRFGGPGGQLDQKMISYLEKNRGSARWLVAVSSAQQASSLILRTGEPVIAMGGFTGGDPAMTVAKLQRYVERGELRHVLVNGQGGGFGPDRGNSEVTAWVQQHGTLVSAGEYGGTSDSGAQLYRLS